MYLINPFKISYIFYGCCVATIAQRLSSHQDIIGHLVVQRQRIDSTEIMFQIGRPDALGNVINSYSDDLDILSMLVINVICFNQTVAIFPSISRYDYKKTNKEHRQKLAVYSVFAFYDMGITYFGYFYYLRDAKSCARSVCVCCSKTRCSLRIILDFCSSGEDKQPHKTINSDS